MRLMCDMSLEFSQVEERYSLKFAGHFKPELERLSEFEADGLIELESDRLSVTTTGRYLIRNLVMVFDQYSDSSRFAYSRTV